MAAGPNVGGGKRGGAAQTVGVLNLLTDLAFNLLIFFVVCASTEPEKGRPQVVPSTKEDKDKPPETKTQNVEIDIKPDYESANVLVNKEEITIANLAAVLKEKLAGKSTVEERIVIVRSDPESSYSKWIRVTALVERAGGIVRVQLEEVRKVEVKN